MKPATALPARVAALLVGLAGGQQYKAEIDNVAKLLASRDAGAGPTTGAASSAGGAPSSQAGQTAVRAIPTPI